MGSLLCLRNSPETKAICISVCFVGRQLRPSRPLYLQTPSYRYMYRRVPLPSPLVVLQIQLVALQKRPCFVVQGQPRHGGLGNRRPYDMSPWQSICMAPARRPKELMVSRLHPWAAIGRQQGSSWLPGRRASANR